MKNLVAFYKDGEYKVGTIDERRFSISENKEFPAIPKYSVTLEDLESMPNAGFFEEGEYYRIFDTRNEEYETLRLPIYIDFFGEIRETKKYAEIAFPTKSSLRAAKDMVEEIEIITYNKINDLLKNQYKDEIIGKLNKSHGIAYFNYFSYNAFKWARASVYEDTRILVVWKSHDTRRDEYQVIFANRDMVKSKEINLYVPKKLVTLVIGHGGETIKGICKLLKCKINVKGK